MKKRNWSHNSVAIFTVLLLFACELVASDIGPQMDTLRFHSDVISLRFCTCLNAEKADSVQVHEVIGDSFPLVMEDLYDLQYSEVWIKCRIINAGLRPISYFFALTSKIGIPIPKLRVWVQDGQRLVDWYSFGYLSDQQKTHPVDFARSTRTLDASKEATIWVRAQVKDTYFLPVKPQAFIYPQEEIIQDTLDLTKRKLISNIWFGVLSGIFLGCFIYAFSLRLLNPESYFSYYSFYILASFFYVLIELGKDPYVGLSFILPPNLFYQHSLFSLLSIIAYIHFFRSVLDIKTQFPAFDNVLRYLTIGLWISVVLDLLFFYVFDEPVPGFLQTWLSRLIALGFGIVAIIKIASRSDLTARWIIAGTAFWLLGTIFFMLQITQILHWHTSYHFFSNPHTWLQIGTIIEIICFSFALSHKQKMVAKEKMKWEQEALEKERNRKATLLAMAGIAHEIAPSLSIIDSNLKKIYGLDDYEKAITKKATDDLAYSFSEIKMLAEGNYAPEIEIELKRVEILGFLQWIIDGYRAQAAEYTQEICLESSLHELEIITDPKVIQIVLQHLFQNALKYNSRPGLVRVVITIHPKKKPFTHLAIDVVDQGVGIPESELDAIFGGLFRASNVRSPKFPGSGLGLVRARKYAEAIDGNIEVTSRIKEGSIFRFVVPVIKEHTDYTKVDIFELPLYNKREALSPSELPTLKGISRPLCLVVEDHPHMIYLLERVFKGHLEIMVANNGQDGIKFAKDKNPDIILCDVGIPDLDGLEVCRKLKNDLVTCHIPIILLSGYSGKQDIIRGYHAGANAYFTKPFDEDLLLAKIKAQIFVHEQLKKRFKQLGLDVHPSLFRRDRDALFLEQVYAKFEQNISNPAFKVTSIAKELKPSTTRQTFGKQFKKLTGKTPHEYLKRKRMETARDYLIQHKHSTNHELAALVGYANGDSLIKAFKEVFQFTPKAYLKRLHEEEE